MVVFHQQNPWLTYRKINRRSHWFSNTWKLLTHELNGLGPQHHQLYWMQFWIHQVTRAKITASLDQELDENQKKILDLIFGHHPCPGYLKDDSLMDDQSLASTIAFNEDLNLVLVLSDDE